jgi:hypothetical protein
VKQSRSSSRLRACCKPASATRQPRVTACRTWHTNTHTHTHARIPRLHLQYTHTNNTPRLLPRSERVQAGRARHAHARVHTRTHTYTRTLNSRTHAHARASTHSQPTNTHTHTHAHPLLPANPCLHRVDGRSIAHEYHGHEAPVVALQGDEVKVVSAASDGVVRTFSMQMGEELFRIEVTCSTTLNNRLCERG